MAALAAIAMWGCAATGSKPKDDMGASMNEWRSERAVEKGIQKQIQPPTDGARRRESDLLGAGEPIWLQSGKSRVLHLSNRVKRVSLGNPDLAGIVVLGPQTIMINAKDLPRRQGPATAGSLGTGRVGVVSGRPFTPEPQVAETTLAVWYGGAERPDVHTVFVADFLDQQVMLEVTVAELNRTAMENHGIDFRQIGTSFVSAYFMGGGVGPRVPGLATTVPPIATPLFPLTLAEDKPQFAFQLPQDDITAFIKFLQTEGLATVLAQPKLVAMSGQSAVFQVGGEIPIRIVTSFVSDIQFKPFGTLVTFIPRVSEEGEIMLTVTPEVSQPDFSSPVEGIPTFRTRRASTSARLKNGETLVIGGLMQRSRREEVRGLPYLKDIPGIGYIFRDTIYIDDVTELMVVVTPRLVQPMAPGTELALPTDRPPLTKDDMRTAPDPAEVTRPRVPEVFLP
jgi:Flp pilus assembly secretin CpaC